MGITVQDVLRLEIMGGAKLLSAEHELEAEVTGISIMEGPDLMQWVQGGEVILTNLYAVSLSEENLHRFVDSLRTMGLSALVVKLNRYMHRVPAEIMDEAQRQRLPVIQLPNEIPFTQVLYPVMATLLDSQVIPLDYFRRTSNLLIGLALKNVGIEGIAGALADIIGNPVQVFDDEMNLLCSTGGGADLSPGDRALEPWRHGEYRYQAFHAQVRGEQCLCLLAPVRLYDDVTAAWLGISLRNHSLQELDHIAIQNAVAVLGLERLKWFTTRERERLLRSEVLEELISGNLSTEFQRHAGSIGLDPGRAYTVMLIEAAGSQDPAGEGGAGDPVVDFVDQLMQGAGLPGLAVEYKQSGLILLPEQEREKGAPAQYIDDLRKKLADRFPGSDFYIGFINAFTSIDRLSSLYGHVALTLRLAKLRRPERGDVVMEYGSLGILKLLGSDLSRERLLSLVPDRLMALRQYDADHDGALVETLSGYFERNRNAKATADALYVHHKTVAYRLQKIKDLTGVDYRSCREMLELELGLLALELADNA